ncbi:MAG: amidinotransferase [Thermoprotei archaeon]|nr:MAG: amidinotransferase [Thermoprotei archaeon]
MDRLFDQVIVRPPSKSIVGCISTNPLRTSVDPSKASRQHREYVKILREQGIEVIEMPPLEEHPDSVFVQDTAVVGSRSRRALIARFGAVPRRGEEVSVENLLRRMGFETVRVEEPGTLEGGDVMVTDLGLVYVGVSGRTNTVGVEYLRKTFPEVKVVEVPVTKVLHLLSAVNYIGNKTVAIVPELVDPSYFSGFKLIRVPLEEAYAANMLYLGERRVLIPAGYPETAERLRREGYKPIEVEISEFYKCDGGVTCLSLPLYKAL